MMLILVCYQGGFSQKSISKKDIEITTQLTFIKVQETDKEKFETALSQLSALAKKNKLKEDFDWLTYEADNNDYLFISFSIGLGDVLKLHDYEEAFDRLGKKDDFNSILDTLKSCQLGVNRHFLQEMLLPWSTVKEIYTSEHPLTTMVEYKVYPKNLDEFDSNTRQLAKLLKETQYPYPLEGNRGAFGAYGSLFHIWFYDNQVEDLASFTERWMTKKGKEKEWKLLHQKFDAISFSHKTYKLKYIPKISY